MIYIQLRRKVRVTSVLHLVYRLQRDYEGQPWLFVLGLFLWEQLLDVLKGFGISVSERVRWYIALERKCICPASLMQLNGCELHVEQLSTQKRF